MSRAFIDTNILIYFSTGETSKGEITRKLLEMPKEFFISQQVLNEFAAVCIRKRLLSLSAIKKYVKEFDIYFNAALMNSQTVLNGLSLIEKYSFSYWDSLILASAIDSNCSVLYSEDLQHNQKISFSKKHISIINPFV